jgi:hypothetical protein
MERVEQLQFSVHRYSGLFESFVFAAFGQVAFNISELEQVVKPKHRLDFVKLDANRRQAILLRQMSACGERACDREHVQRYHGQSLHKHL